MAVMGGSFALLVLGAAADRWAPVFGIVIGVSYSVQGTIGPAFIVGADLSHAQVAKQLSAYNLAFPAGQLIGSLVIAAMQAAGWSTAQVFLAATAVTLLLAAISWPAMTVPARRLTAATLAPPVHDAEDAAAPEGAARRGFRSMLQSTFGVFLLVVVLSSIDNNGLTSQISTVMPQVCGFSDSATSLLVGLAGLINIPVIIGTGIWMARSPSTARSHAKSSPQKCSACERHASAAGDRQAPGFEPAPANGHSGPGKGFISRVQIMPLGAFIHGMRTKTHKGSFAIQLARSVVAGPVCKVSRPDNNVTHSPLAIHSRIEPMRKLNGGP